MIAATTTDPARPAGIDGSALPGPYGVGSYAAKLRSHLQERPRVQLFGELWNLRVSRAKVYFELRDVHGALPCSMWRNQYDALALDDGALRDGARIVVAGGLDYYVGSRTSSPAFSFVATAVRVAGEGDLLAQLDRLRKALDAEGLFEPQKTLALPMLPRTIGVVTSENGKARDDITAGLERRGWAGRLVWAFAPVQDRHAAPAITAALQDLAATGQVDVIIVARGGGSLAELFCFCDETLCRTVALLGVPIVASVGHHTDRTLIDDVATLSCSTPTHAAESAVPLHCAHARTEVAAIARRLHVHAGRARRTADTVTAAARRLRTHGRRAVLERAHKLTHLSRAPSRQIDRERARLHTRATRLQTGGQRQITAADARTVAAARGLQRRAQTTAANATGASGLTALAAALAAHDPDRTLQRGYALVTDATGAPVMSAAAAREQRTVTLRFSDTSIHATIGAPHEHHDDRA
ncbi:MAG TPA: exodeoxyribonuclease VII large subunit [Solirubrobacteraceae bacterium]|jgi:exodeoxyribonuclease VII large subunit|nr:exodeoxyribonuclease VII large subunit [Solirubrobacteraceae bacterium]